MSKEFRYLAKTVGLIFGVSAVVIWGVLALLLWAAATFV